MTLIELQKILGERIEIANDLAMSEDERRKETEKSDLIVRLAKQMINNADVVLRRDKAVGEGRIVQGSSIDKFIGV